MTVLERIVVKEQFFVRGDLNSPHWNYTVNGVITPREAYCHQILQTPNPAAGVAQDSVRGLSGWSIQRRDVTWRLFLEYAPYGDLDELIREHQRLA